MTDPIAIVPIITNAGFAAVVRAQGDGLQAQLSHMAVGRGIAAGGVYGGYAPAITRTALAREDARVPLLSGQVIDGGFRVLGRFEPTTGGLELPVWEVGFWLSTGELLAVWSHTEAWPLTARTPLAGVDLAFELRLAQIPLSALTITVLQPDIPDTTTVLAEMLAMQARLLIGQINLTDRLIAGRL